ncbi:spore coat U domain-containing protein [Pectobacterium cacticida]|uniref:Spore coat U domain-containing protein n=1 Tax=Pectobacterium cacticida TaxID=69221 RepID=A0ABZ2GDI9_9GAMM|nr:spore coat U domain-containing protein [Pectobacterium cacticida]UYX05705.1 spore coat U domain-containing protein [Pectobacterium cacticida]
MKAKPIILPILSALFTSFCLTNTANGVTITGQIPLSLTITAACTVNNGGGAGATWGTIDFGAHSGLDNAINSQATSTGGNGVTVNCSVGTPAALHIDAGANATDSLRRLAPDTGTYHVPYRLYSDANRTAEIPLTSTGGIAIVATGNPQLIPVYASILPSDQTVIAPTAGSYTDTVTATIEW